MARGTYQFVPRPAGTGYQHPYLVFDGQDRLHFHLTVFVKEATAQLSESTVRTYLYAVLPFFHFLDTDIPGNSVLDADGIPRLRKCARLLMITSSSIFTVKYENIVRASSLSPLPKESVALFGFSCPASSSSIE